MRLCAASTLLPHAGIGLIGEIGDDGGDRGDGGCDDASEAAPVSGLRRAQKLPIRKRFDSCVATTLARVARAKISDIKLLFCLIF